MITIVALESYATFQDSVNGRKELIPSTYTICLMIVAVVLHLCQIGFKVGLV